MAQINFPAASESPWYNPDNGVTYEYVGGTWRTVTDNGSSLDDIYVKEIGDTMTGELILYGNPAQNLGATPKQYVDTEITNAISGSEGSETGRLDGRYLRKDSAAGAQTVASTGTTTFDGLVEAGGGVKVTGGNRETIKTGFTNNLDNESRGITLTIGELARSGGGLYGWSTYLDDDSITIDSDQTFNVYDCSFSSDLDCSFTGFRSAYTGLSGTVAEQVGFWAPHGGSKTNINTAVGFKSSINTQSGLNRYNFYANGTAPNFYKGDTYIGGNTTRNTRELWESTLTEEQKEQLADGTLVAPANVSLPGDGSFARQWYYDQQDAETQAELDAGTLDYPTHLVAATFTDTFDLGDNTKIDLLSTGESKFKGTMKLEKNIPVIQFIDTSQSADERTFAFRNASGALTIQALDDSGAGGGDSFRFNRTGYNINSITANSAGTPWFTIDNANKELVVDGSVEANGLIEAGDGVKVTGGSDAGVTTGLWSNNSGLNLTFDDRRQVSFNDDRAIRTCPDIAGDSIGWQANAVYTEAVTACRPFTSFINSSVAAIPTITHFEASQAPTVSAGIVKGFSVSPNLGDGTTASYGFWSNLAVSTGPANYNFYAAGNAPNYFKGPIKNLSDPTADNSDLLDGTDNTTGCSLSDQGVYISKRVVSNSPNVGAFTVQVKDSNASQTTANFTQALARFTFFDSTGAAAASDIRGDGSGGIFLTSPSDYRTKNNIVDLPSAVDAIKALRPVNYNYTWAPNRTRPGFIAHELQETLPAAVVGTKDETEAIGTLADYDGTVLETEVTEPEELTYTEDATDEYGVTTATVRTRTWTATGTRPVYQGVDQTKLIPLLTKALQEALERIEALEAAQ